MKECKACRFTSEMHKEIIEKELSKLSAKDTAQPDERERRLLICSSCKHLDVSGTCMMCGCYVMLRTALKNSRCPQKYW